MRRYQVFVGLRSESDRKTLERIVGEWFEGATIVPSRGLWRGTAEDSSVVEVLIDGAHMKDTGHTMRVEDVLMGLAESLRHELEPQS